MEPQAQIITIIVYSDIDPSQLLEIANEAAERIAEEVETYGEDAHFLPEETSVEYSDNGGKEIVGGHQHA